MQLKPIPPVAWIVALLAVETTSFFGWVFPSVSGVVCVILALCIGFYSLKDLRIGVIAVCTELIIGSQGYVFSWNAAPLIHQDIVISFRLTLFCVVLFCGLVHAWKHKRLESLHARYMPLLMIMLAGIVYGVIMALATGNARSAIFYDVNAWLFLGMSIPFAQSLRTREDVIFVLSPILWALWWLALKTVFLFVLFSHPESFESSLGIVYRWIRDTRVAEIFRFESGFARVFLQSHIYALVSLLMVALAIVRMVRVPRWMWVCTAALCSTVLISYSRTFWLVGACVGVCVIVLFAVRDRQLLPQYIKRIAQLGGVALVAASVVYLLVRIPLPNERAQNTGSLFVERVTDLSSEAAAVTRMQQLGPLLHAISQHPLRGSGFGATITYTSADPRVLAARSDGAYTTFAFEWAYLDFFYKLGAIGFLCVVAPLVYLVTFSITTAVKHRSTTLGMSSVAVLTVLGVHVLTPYINHPLGLGIVLLAVVYNEYEYSRL